MFAGRVAELNALEEAYKSPGPQMYVIYGRRRIGKTELINQFSKDKPTLWFTARDQTDRDNLRDMTRAALAFFHESDLPIQFADWLDLFRYIASKAQQIGRFLVVFDEFPYAASHNSALPSSLQIALDREFKDTGIFLILCGSNQGFMESEVLGAKSPLYGRRTGQIKLKPLSIFEAIQLMPQESTWQDHVTYYATLGGTPYYLNQLREGHTFAQNIERLMFRRDGLLYAEPEMLLREELRDPSTYQSVLEAVAHGENRPKAIADRTGLSAQSLMPYLSMLMELGLIRRDTPFGDKSAKSRKSQYHIADPFFAYWYRFVAPMVSLIERDQGAIAVQTGTQGGPFDTYIGSQFEDLCMQWIFLQAALGNLDLLPVEAGKWWGTDPSLREQTDIDIVIEDSIIQTMLLGECKWRNSFDVSEAISKLQHRSTLLNGPSIREFWLFTKYPVTVPDDIHTIDAKQMFE